MTDTTEEAQIAESEFPKQASSGSGGGRGYSVEVRLNYNGAAEIVNGIAVGPNWTRLHFEKAVVGVPQGNVCWGHLPNTSLLGYASAQALRWWFLANAEATRGHALCIETRLVRHDCTYSYKETPVAAQDETGESQCLSGRQTP
jgi:hypothetical protein